MEKPNVVISRCINIEAVRYDGGIIRDKFAEVLGRHVHYIPVCPEVSIGLGIPRQTLRLVQEHNVIRLMQPATGNDYTEQMNVFTEQFLDSLRDIDGFLLKSRSPSSGISGVKIYQSLERSAPIGTGSGLFAAGVLQRYPHHPVEDEGRLNDPDLRSHFLMKLFAYHEFRILKGGLREMKDLIDFHTRYKLIYAAYSQARAKALGRIIANHEHLGLPDLLSAYEDEFVRLFSRNPSYRSHINILMHALGYVSESLSPAEKKHFLGLLDKYGNKWIPVTVPLEVLRNHLLRVNNEYLLGQKYLNPYPEELLYFSS